MHDSLLCHALTTGGLGLGDTFCQTARQGKTLTRRYKEILNYRIVSDVKSTEYPHARVASDKICIVSDLDLWEKQCTFAAKLRQ